MIVSHRKLGFTVALLVAALAGLVGVQAVLLNLAWQAKTRAFQRNVRSALALTVQQLDAAEVARDATDFVLQHAVIDTTGFPFTLNRTVIDTSRTGPGLRHAVFDTTAGDFALKYTFVDTTNLAVLDAFSSKAEDFKVHLMTTPRAGLALDTLVAVVAHPDTFVYSDFAQPRYTWSRGDVSQQVSVTIETDRRQFIKRVVSGMIDEAQPPIDERLAAVKLDSVLAAQLADAGIDATPEIAVLNVTDNTPVRLPADAVPADFVATPFRARLFSLDLAPPFHDLALRFPGERAWLLRETAPLFIASGLFLAVIVFGFVQTMRTLLEQRRFAAQVVNFVNNMTHEFKTPLSTLTLAAEAIARGADPDDETLLRYTRMIREETARMGLQAERILQVARLERGELELSSVTLDGCRLVADVAEAFELRVRERGGRLTTDLAQTRCDLLGDEMHLTAALDNLLDNALKYSPGQPEIALGTAVQGGDVVITITDRGVGIPRSDRERVFEPYYRCPTGDRHDVKGHGLGLSYVRLVAEAHGGSIHLGDNPGGGTRVKLRLPLAPTTGRPQA